MKFNLDFAEAPEAERIWVNLLSRQPHCYGSIRAIFDTGSPTTVISARDVFRLSLPLNNMEQGEPIKGFGKGGIPSKKFKKFIFALKSEENSVQQIEMPVHAVDTSILQRMPQEYLSHVLQIPTIIGMDFLRQARMKAVIDPIVHKAFFESS